MQPLVPNEPTTPNWERVTLAEQQPEYSPLTVVRDSTVEHVPTITVWEPSDEECALLAQQIADGQVRISIQQWQFKRLNGTPQPFAPMQVKVGTFDEPYDSEVVRVP